MLYEKYQRKIEKIGAVKKWMKSHRVLLIVAAAVAFVLLISFLSVKGVVFSRAEMPAAITYGDDVPYRASALFGSVSYEYAAEGTEEWTTAQPARKGSYLVRARSKNIFGAPYYTQPQAFKVLPRPLDVAVAGDTAVYGDKQELSARLMFADNISCELFDYEKLPSGKTRVTCDKNAVMIRDNAGNDVTDSYLIQVVPAEVTFTRRALTVTVSNASRVYDGTALSFDGYEVTGGSLAAGDSLLATFDKQQIDAGEAENAPQIQIVTTKGFNVTELYDTQVVSGKLTVQKRPVFIKTKSFEKVYDGLPLVDDSVYTPASDTPLVAGHKLERIGGASLSDVGTRDNLPLFKITDGDRDVTDNYSFLFPQDSKLKVLPRTLTIKTAGAAKAYDGLPLRSDSYTLESQAKPLAGHQLALTFGSGQTRAGTSANTVEKAEVTAGGNNVTNNYAFEYICGELTVSPASVRVRTATARFTYNGKAQSDGGVELLSGTLAAGDSVLAVNAPALTDAGTTENRFAVRFTDEKGDDVTESYYIVYDYGTLTVEKSAVTVTTGSGELYYSGTGQSLASHTVSPEIAQGQASRAKAETLTVIKEVERISGGGFKPYDNVFEIGIFSGDKDVTYNYELTYVYGVIKMLPKILVVTTGTAEFIYDGKDKSDDSFSLSAFLASGHTARITSAAPILNDVVRLGNGSVTSVSNVFSVGIFSSENQDVSDSYTLSYVYGVLTVKPRPLNITTATNEWEYDGQAHSDGGCSADNLAEGHTAAALVSTLTKITNVLRLGDRTVTSVENVFIAQIFSADKNVTQNYEISYTYGTLTVLPRQITVTTNTNAWEYDGAEHNDKGFTVTKGSLVSTHTTKVYSYSGIINVIRPTADTVGSLQNLLQFYILQGSNSVADNYEVEYIYGTLTILPRKVEITTNTNTWVYDGLTHLDLGYSVTSGSLVRGHSFALSEFAPVPTIRNAGSKDNSLEYDVYGSSAEKQTPNYELSYVYGTISVTPRPIKIKIVDRSKQYNGQPLTSSEYIISSGSIVEGQWVALECGGSQTEIGSSDNDVTKLQIFSGDEDVIYNYDVSTVKGTLTVTLRSLTIKAGSAYKLYDGTELTSADYIYSGLLEGHALSAQTQGGQTEVGYGINKIDQSSVRITANGWDVSAYYKLSLSDGVLQVGLRNITLKTSSSEKKYDGLPLTDGRYEIVGELMAGDRAEVEVFGSRINVGYSENFARIKLFDSTGKDITYCYIVTVAYGRLTVTGSSGLNTDGSINIPPEDGGEGGGTGGGSGGAADKTVFTATSDTSGSVYFRVKSFGDYNVTKGWDNAQPYGSEGFNALQFTNYALSAAGKKRSTVTIEMASSNLSYMLPYYAYNGYLTMDDTQILSDYGNPYAIEYISYSYSPNDAFSLGNSYLAPQEREYYQFVLNTYLALPETTREKLLEIADRNNLRAGSKTVISDVAKYVQKKVKYSLEPEQYLGDIALYFFTTAQTGLCRHYATAATAMLRALGIPARYTIGYTGTMSAGQAVKVTEDQAHAWVEVYLPGMGWVQIEVTGGGEGSGAGDGSGEGDSDIGGEGGAKLALTIKPVDVFKEYDGTTLFAKNEVEGVDLDSILAMEEFAERGYKYQASASGSRTNYGTTKSTIVSFILYDKYNRNITEKFNVIYLTGNVRILYKPIYIHLYSLEKNYDGMPLSYEKKDYSVEGLPSGFRLDFNLSGSLTEAGILQFAELEKLPYSVYDDRGNAVTDLYSLVFVGKPLRVNRRALEITSASATKAYDGSPLTNSLTWISKGFFVPEHRYEATVVGTITDIGTASNRISNVIIYDAQNNTVTKNYKITLAPGTLKIIG